MMRMLPPLGDTKGAKWTKLTKQSGATGSDLGMAKSGNIAPIDGTMTAPFASFPPFVDFVSRF